MTKTDNMSGRTPYIAPHHFLLGSLPNMQKDTMNYLANLLRQHGDVIQLHVLRDPIYLVAHPDAMHHILQANAKNYHKYVNNYKILYPLVGQGLLTSDGEHWLRQRRLAQPAFHRQRIAGFAGMMTQAAARLAGRWQTASQSGLPLAIDEEMSHITLEIVGKALLSMDLSGTASGFGEAFQQANQSFSLSNFAYTMFPWLPSPSNLRLRRAVKVMDQTVYDILRQRRSAANRNDTAAEAEDLLDLLLHSADEETGEQMTDAQLRDEVITILLAGHETTAMTLSWLFLELTRWPEVEARLHKELDEVLGGRPPTLEDLPRLDYTRRVVQETLRKYPAAWMIARGAYQEDVLCGYRIPAGATLMVSLYLLHHDPRFWPEPERFDPDRFLPEAVAERHKYAYLPFSSGARKCIGDQFAQMEAVLILATLAQSYRLRMAGSQVVEMEPLITLRMRGNLQMQIERR